MASMELDRRLVLKMANDAILNIEDARAEYRANYVRRWRAYSWLRKFLVTGYLGSGKNLTDEQVYELGSEEWVWDRGIGFDAYCRATNIRNMCLTANVEYVRVTDSDIEHLREWN